MAISHYSFTDYDPHWPAAFEKEADTLRSLLGKLLGERLVTIHHIGSTSVPHLAAKPTIDMLPIVASPADFDLLTPQLREAGYRAWGAYGLPGRCFFTKDHNGHRTHNIHFYALNHPDILRHLSFCRYLAHHPAVALEYQSLKRQCYASHPNDIVAYNDAKNDWIKHHEPIALSWYSRTFCLPPG